MDLLHGWDRHFPKDTNREKIVFYDDTYIISLRDDIEYIITVETEEYETYLYRDRIPFGKKVKLDDFYKELISKFKFILEN